MKQILATFAVAAIGMLVLVHDAQLVHSAHIHSANSTNNATNASKLLDGLRKNLSHVHDLVHNLTHKLDHLKLNQTNGTNNATKVHKAPHVVSVHRLNSTNATGPSGNSTNQNVTSLLQLVAQNSRSISQLSGQVFYLSQAVQNLTQGLNSTNRTHNVRHFPVVVPHRLNSTNITGPSGNSSLVPVQNLTNIVAQNSRSISQLSNQVFYLSQAVQNLTQGLNSTANRTIHRAPIHFPTVVIAHGLNATNATGPGANRTQPIHFPIVAPIHLNSTNSTQNSTRVHVPQIHFPVHQNVTGVNQTQLAKNVSHIQKLMETLAEEIEQVQLF